MTVAGPVFGEWYWGPVFFALVFGPLILLVAIILTGVFARRAKRHGRPLPRTRILLLGLALTAALSLLTVAGLWLKERTDENRRVAQQAAALTFQTYEPTRIFPGYEAERVRPIALSFGQWVDFRYRRGNDYVFAFQSPLASKIDISEAGCGIHLAGLSSGETVGSCTTVIAEGGRQIHLTELERSSLGRHVALVELGETSAYVVYSELDDEAAVDYLNALRPIAPEELDYFGGY
ncbi:MAG: hypothetical protein ACRDK3_07005 [Actinomycetota bacterium]